MSKFFKVLGTLLAIAAAVATVILFWDKISSQATKVKDTLEEKVPFLNKKDNMAQYYEEI